MPENYRISADYNTKDLFWKNFSGREGSPYLLNTNLESMNCLFIHPTKGDDLSKDDYPISIGYMASLVRMNGGKASISAYDITSYNKDAFSGFDLVCFYPMVASLPFMLKLPTQIKKDFPEAKICFFNSEQHQHEMILNSPKAVDFGISMLEGCTDIDFALIGEAETSFLRLCAKVVEGNSDLADVPCCVYREGGVVKKSLTQIKSVDFQFLPYPARDFLEQGMTKEGVNLKSPRIQSARGCVAPCLYCIESSSNLTINGRKVPLLRRSISDFVDEIEFLQKEFGVIFFNVIDSSFEDAGRRGIERMGTFCDEIEKRGIKASFKIHQRAETVCKLDDALLLKLKHAGVDIIGIGVESGLQHELESYKKIASVDESLRAVLRVEAADRFFCIVGHMMFSPVLELADLPKKVEFLGKINRVWDYLDMSNNVIIFPGTAYHTAMKEQGFIISDYDPLSGNVPYRYKDERVSYVATAMGNLKIKCPSIIELNNKLYDALNIASRYQNSLNKHLSKRPEFYTKFRGEVSTIQDSTAQVLSQYFLGLVELAERGFDDAKAENLYESLIPAHYNEAARKINDATDTLLGNYERAGLSTTTLTLRTWMSIINTQENTAGGVGGK